MKKVVHKHSGETLTYHEATVLFKKLRKVLGNNIIRHFSTSVYPYAQIAKDENLPNLICCYPHHIFLYTGAVDRYLTGYKACVIVASYLPQNFEEQFHEYSIIVE